MQQGAYLVPYEKYNDEELSNDGDIGHAWQYSFVSSENLLLKEMPKQGRYLYKVLLGLIEPIEQLCSINNVVLHQCFLHSLFWYCEKESFEEPESATEIQKTVITSFLQFMFEFFVNNKLPDYFIPEVDLLKTLGAKSSEKLKEVIESMVDDDDFLDEVLSDTSFTRVLKYFSKALDEASRSLFLQNVQDKVIESLSVSFSGMIKVFHQSTFCKLHQGSDLHACMDLHCKVLSSIKALDVDSKIKDWCMRLVSNSLGSLYLAKAQESMVTTSTGFLNKTVKKVATKETDFFIQKAEELLLMSNNIDLIAGRVKLANFYYINGQVQECFDLVDEIFHVTGICPSKDSTRESSPMAYSEESFSPEYVLRELVNRNIILDVLYSNMDKYTLPAFIRKNLSLTGSQLLGGESLSVYVLDADVYAHFLHAMCYYHLGKREEACGILEKLENLWNKTQSDLSEKRNLCYLNTIAGCYIEIGEKEKGKELLEKSCKFLSNPIRNPARFKLLAVRTEKTKQIAKRTIGVAVGIAVFATVAGVVKNKFF
jgi:tetratricopeptide (TPR) repeat protein